MNNLTGTIIFGAFAVLGIIGMFNVWFGAIGKGTRRAARFGFPKEQGIREERVEVVFPLIVTVVSVALAVLFYTGIL